MLRPVKEARSPSSRATWPSAPSPGARAPRPLSPSATTSKPSTGRHEGSTCCPRSPIPDHQTEIYEELIPPCALIGRFQEALRLVGAHAELSRRLTPHHRIHSIAIELEVKELMGEWASIQERRPIVEQLVAENLDTPCIRNSRSLLVEAVAHAYGGDHDTARRLEERALEIAFEGFGFRLFGPRVRLALLRNELDVVEEMIDQDVARRGHDWMVTSATVTTRLDGLLALGTARGRRA